MLGDGTSIKTQAFTGPLWRWERVAWPLEVPLGHRFRRELDTVNEYSFGRPKTIKDLSNRIKVMKRWDPDAPSDWGEIIT